MIKENKSCPIHRNSFKPINLHLPIFKDYRDDYNDVSQYLNNNNIKNSSGTVGYNLRSYKLDPYKSTPFGGPDGSYAKYNYELRHLSVDIFSANHIIHIYNSSSNDRYILWKKRKSNPH